MFRSDRDALAQEVDELRRQRAELEAQNDAMRTDLLARRQQLTPSRGPLNVYKQGTDHLTPGERVALRRHDVSAFPVWVALVLHFLTFGMFSFVHLSLLHGKLPQVEHDDPSPARAIGFSLIPYFNFYWVVFNVLRLADRINLQFRLRGRPNAIPRGLAIAAGVILIVPYVNILGALLLLPIAVAYFQRAANMLAAFPRDGSDARVAEGWATDGAAESAGDPRLRVPLVRDLPGPDEAAEHDAEVDADEPLRRRAAR